jgi:hypothetical protein
LEGEEGRSFVFGGAGRKGKKIDDYGVGAIDMR